MYIVLVLLALILIIVLVLIFGGAEQRAKRKKEMKEEAKRQKREKAEVKRKNREAKRESRKYVDIFEEDGHENVQEGTMEDAKKFQSENEEPINPDEISEILNEDNNDGVSNYEQAENGFDGFRNDVWGEQDGQADNNEQPAEENHEPEENKMNEDTGNANNEEDMQQSKDTNDNGIEFNKDLFGDFFNDDNNQ